MKKRIVLSAFIAFTALTNAQNNQLQNDSTTSMHDSLKEVTITATRTTKNIMDVGRSVTIISAEQIKQASCNTVADLLSQQEGIYILGTGQNPGAIENLFMRGADANNTTILIDGVPIIDPSTDHSQIDLSELSLAGVDRIEIVRGSHSTLYGTSSIGGVINIITKKNYTPGFHVSVSATGGIFGPGTKYLDGNIFLDYTFKNGFYATVGYHKMGDKGLNATVDTITRKAPFQLNPDADNYNKSESFGKVGFVNKKWDIYGEYRNVIQNSDADGGPFTDLKNATDHFVRDFYIGGINYKINNNFQLQYAGSYSHNYRIYNQGLDTIDAYGDYTTVNDMYKGTAATHEVKAEYDFKTSHIIVGGGSNMETMHLSEYSTYNTNAPYYDNPDSVKFRQTIYNVYAQADMNGGTFKKSLSPYSLLVGMRYSNNSRIGDNLSYEINPYYKINKNSVMFLSYSTGFNAPSLYQTYSPSVYGNDPLITIGNSKLAPETSNSLEIGMKHRVSNSIFFTLSWFKTEVDNYIDYVALWTKNKPVDSLGYSDFMGNTYLNVGKQINQGFEVSATVKLSDKVEVSGNVSLMSGILKYSQSTVDTGQTHEDQVQIYDGGAFLYGNKAQENGLLRRPGSLGNFTFTYHPIKNLAFAVRARYVGSRYDAQYDYTLGPNGALAFATVGDYTLLDAFVSYNYNKHLSAMFRCENIFNTKYSEILGYTTRGRGFYLNLRYSL